MCFNCEKCYGAILTALKSIYQECHEPEALGIHSILSKPSTLFALYLLDYIFPQVSKLSKSLQAVQLDLSVISSLVDATLHTLDNTLQPSANWVLDLIEVREDMKSFGIVFESDDVTSFQHRVADPFFTKLKTKPSKTTSFHKMLSPVSAFLILRIKAPNFSKNSTYGEDQVKTLLTHYGLELPAETVLRDEFLMPPLITGSDLLTQWKTFRQYIRNQPRKDVKEQLKELTTNSMIQTMFPNLTILVNVCLTIPVGTPSVERSFSHMKMIKSCLRNRLGEHNLSYLMKIALESPEALSDEDLENIVTIWDRKPRRMTV